MLTKGGRYERALQLIFRSGLIPQTLHHVYKLSVQMLWVHVHVDEES